MYVGTKCWIKVNVINLGKSCVISVLRIVAKLLASGIVLNTCQSTKLTTAATEFFRCVSAHRIVHISHHDAELKQSICDDRFLNSPSVSTVDPR